MCFLLYFTSENRKANDDTENQNIFTGNFILFTIFTLY